MQHETLDYGTPSTRRDGRRAVWPVVLATLGGCLFVASLIWCALAWTSGGRLIFLPAGDAAMGFRSKAGWLSWIEYTGWDNREYTSWSVPWAVAFVLELLPLLLLARARVRGARRMYSVRVRITNRTSALVFGILGVLALIAAGVSAALDRLSKTLDADAQRLVYHTDHRAVLDACRVVIADPQGAGFPHPKPGGSAAIVIGTHGGQNPPAALPAALRDLKFESLMVDGGQATIFFGGGFGHWGFQTAPVGAGAQVELIPGLWFWSEYGLPRDLSKSPYYRTSKRLTLGAVIALMLSLVAGMRSRRSVRRAA